MNDPNTTATAATAGASIAAAAVAMNIDVGLIGFIAGLIALLHVKPEDPNARTPMMVFALIAGSGFLALIFTQLGVALAAGILPESARGINPDALRWPIAAAIGGGVHLPFVRQWLARRFNP